MQKEIVQFENPVLRKKAEKVALDKITSEEIQSLIAVMKETMRAAPGVGLAAPQIGVSLQIAVIEDPEERLRAIPEEIRTERGRYPVPFHVIINPTLTVIDEAEPKQVFFEGCLSVRGRARITPRANRVEVKCWDEHGKPKTILASGWYARILQHEIDHLNGQLYIDIASEKTEISTQNPVSQKWMFAKAGDILRFTDMHTEKLFSYGTLRYEAVQLATFGRKLNGNEDVLSGFNLTMLEIKDQDVIATSGEAAHPIIKFTGNSEDQVNGFVFDVSPDELEKADLYEVSDYKRISVKLNSGLTAWVYVNA